jgi:hypothetical protein
MWTCSPEPFPSYEWLAWPTVQLVHLWHLNVHQNQGKIEAAGGFTLLLFLGVQRRNPGLSTASISLRGFVRFKLKPPSDKGTLFQMISQFQASRREDGY